MTIPEQQTALSHINTLIQDDKIGQAIDALLDFDRAVQGGQEIHIKAIAGSFQNTKRAYEISLEITREVFGIEIHKVRKALLEITRQFERRTQDPVSPPTLPENPFSELDNLKLALLYDSTDRERAIQINKHLTVLKMTKRIDLYDVHQTDPGYDVVAGASVAISHADSTLVLISSNIFNQDAFWLKIAITALREGRNIIPIRIDKSDIDGTGIEHLRAIPARGCLLESANIELAYSEIAEEIKRLIHKKMG